MQFRELSVSHAYEITPLQHHDGRGVFLEWFRLDLLREATGHDFPVLQANRSVSAKGVLRGIHFADVPPGQAKLVTVTQGAAIDFVVDLRVGSPTFGEWDQVLLDEQDRRCVYLAEGLGHAFVTLADDTTVSYLVTSTYNADAEHTVNPADASLGLAIPDGLGELELSPRDHAAPDLAAAIEAGILPQWSDCLAHYERTSLVI